MPLDPWSYAEKSNTEHANQVALFMWANMAEKFGPIIADDPASYNVKGFALTQFEARGRLGYKRYSAPITQLHWLHAIHNQGHGDAARGAQAKAEGVKAGVADIFLPVPSPMLYMTNPPRPVKYGLYIELKRTKSDHGAAGKASANQELFKDHCQAYGYAWAECVGWIAAKNCLLTYLGISPT